MFNIKSLITPINDMKEKNQKKQELDTYGAVYKMDCENCLQSNRIETYIGETGRCIETRVKEHLRRIKDEDHYTKKRDNLTQVQIHDFLVHRNIDPKWKVLIIKKATKCQERKILEAIMIKKHKPTLNIDQGLSLVTI